MDGRITTAGRGLADERRQKTAAKRYALLSLGLAAALVVGVGLLNFFIDPFNRFGNNRLGVFFAAERESKPRMALKYPHNALLLGNSRIGMTLADQLDGFHFFNAAFAGGTSEEAYYFLKRYAWKDELVVIGVDPGQCDPPELKGDIFAPTTMTMTLSNVVSASTLKYSVMAVLEHLRGRPGMMNPDGSSTPARWPIMARHGNLGTMAWQIAETRRIWSGTSLPAPGKLIFYRRIVELLRERNIACVALIPPLHESLAHYIPTSPVLPAYQAWRREIGSIFPHLVDCAFGPDSAITNFTTRDTTHLRPEAMVRLFNRDVIPVAIQAVRERGSPTAEVNGRSKGDQSR